MVPPKVTAVLPTGDDIGKLLAALAALARQTHADLEVLVVLEPSFAGKRTEIEALLGRRGAFVHAVDPTAKPLPGLSCWRPGVERASGALVWCVDAGAPGIAGIPDNHLARTIASFADLSVMAVVGNPAFRPAATYQILPAHASLRDRGTTPLGSLGISDIVFRRQQIPADLWTGGPDFEGCPPRGNAATRLLETVVHGGQIAIAQDRLSVESRLAGTVYDVPLARKGAVQRTGPEKGLHVLLGFRGFHYGGAEIFPIHLANALVMEGVTVSMLATNPDKEVEALRASLDPRVAVYDIFHAREGAVAAFFADAGIDIVHSHCCSVETMLLGSGADLPGIPYVVSLHGHYDDENSVVEEAMMQCMLRAVSQWVYTAPKNVRFLDGQPLDRSTITHIPNGMGVDNAPFPSTRTMLGISDDDLVFTLVARAIPEKGWREAIEAMGIARRRVSRRLVLLLCGDGSLADELRLAWSDDPDVIFLGFQDRIHGLYRLSDCALLPSRFAGESFPLCLIQSMQAGTPVVASRMGAIGAMILNGTREAGLTFEAMSDTAAFVGALADAIVRMTDDAFRHKRTADAAIVAEAFSIGRCARQYLDLYSKIFDQRGNLAVSKVTDKMASCANAGTRHG